MLQGLPGPKGKKGETVGLDKVRMKTQLANIKFYINIFCSLLDKKAI